MIRVSCSLSERQIACELRKIFFPPKGRICCVRCQSFRVKKVPKEDRYHCPKCRKKFSLLSGTWLGHLRIPLTTFMILLWSWMKGYSVDQAHDLTSLSVVTIRRFFRLFRLNIVKSVSFEPQDSVQVDEAYFGSFKKQSNSYHGVQTYHLKPKVCVSGIACPSLGTLAMRVIHGVKTVSVFTIIFLGNAWSYCLQNWFKNISYALLTNENKIIYKNYAKLFESLKKKQKKIII